MSITDRKLPACVLVNLGTPDEPTPAAVKRFLAEFLHDYRVIPLTRWLWCPLLHGIILPLRAPRVAKLYQKIWWPQGSPLRVIAEQQRCALEARLSGRAKVYYGMRYGNPSLTSVLAEVAQQHDQIIVLPLYPQYSVTTTESVYDVLNVFQQQHPTLSVHWSRDYHTNPLYIEALRDTVLAHWAQKQPAQKLLFSFHGIPEEYVHQGDPYESQCHETARLLAQALGVSAADYAVSFQSRFGPKKWVGPYTEQLLKDWAAAGIRHVDVISPCFSNDCLETLEEIQHLLKSVFIDAGGESYHYIPALNAHPKHIDLMQHLFDALK